METLAYLQYGILVLSALVGTVMLYLMLIASLLWAINRSLDNSDLVLSFLAFHFKRKGYARTAHGLERKSKLNGTADNEGHQR